MILVRKRLPLSAINLLSEEQIRNMIMKYIEPKNTLILAVTPANTDFATSDAIDLARRVDSDSQRTLAVVTKVDIMDHGTDAMDILCGRVLPVNLGLLNSLNQKIIVCS